jgi:hypothetical protein
MLALQRQRVLEEEVGALKARVTALEAGHRPPSPSSRPVTRRTALADYIKQSGGIHPSKRPKKVKKDADMLKDPLNGICLTQPELIAALEAQEAKQAEKDAAKQRQKEEAKAGAKQRRAETTAANKKRKAEEKAAEKAAKRLQASNSAAESQEQGLRALY